MSEYQTISIEEALKALTRPAPGSECDQRIQQIALPVTPKRTLRGDVAKAKQGLNKLSAPRQWKNATIAKACVGLYLVGVLTPSYVHHYAPDKAASAATTPTTVAAVASK